MTPTKESLLTKIRTLLEMTESRGCTEAEAALARAKALNLMCKYGISLEDLAQLSDSILTPQAVPSAPTVTAERRGTAPDNCPPYEYWSAQGGYPNDAFVREVFSRGATRGRKPLHRVAKVIAGFGIAGLAVLITGDVGQTFTPAVGGDASHIASQGQPAAYVSSRSSAQLQPPAVSSSSSPQTTIQGVYQKLYNGWWIKFALGQDGKVVGTPHGAYTP